MKYVTEKYVYGGTSVMAYTDDGEPYAHCSVCLAGYGLVLPEDHIIVPAYELTEDAKKVILDDLADEICGTVTFGPYNAEGILIRLKPEYRPSEKSEAEQIEDLMFNGMAEDEARAFLEMDRLV